PAPVTRMRRSGRVAFSPAIMSNRFWLPRLPNRIRSASAFLAMSLAEADTNSISGSESNSARKPMKRSGSLSTTAIFTLVDAGVCGGSGTSGPFLFAAAGAGAGAEDVCLDPGRLTIAYKITHFEIKRQRKRNTATVHKDSTEKPYPSIPTESRTWTSAQKKNLHTPYRTGLIAY